MAPVHQAWREGKGGGLRGGGGGEGGGGGRKGREEEGERRKDVRRGERKDGGECKGEEELRSVRASVRRCSVLVKVERSVHVWCVWECAGGGRGVGLTWLVPMKMVPV